MATRRHQQTVGAQIRDRAFYDTQHDNVEDKKHLADMEHDARYMLEGIRRRDQQNPAIAQDLDGRAGVEKS